LITSTAEHGSASEGRTQVEGETGPPVWVAGATVASLPALNFRHYLGSDLGSERPGSEH